MNVLIFGASGTIGYGVLLASLDDARVKQVTTVGRSEIDIQHEKLRQLKHANFEDFSALEAELTGVDACFWSLGISSVGLDEEAYRRVTVGFTKAAAETLKRASPGLCFCFVSGTGDG